MDLEEKEVLEANADGEESKLEYNFLEIVGEVNKQLDRIEELRAYFPDSIRVGLFLISCKEIKLTTVEKHQKIVTKIFGLVYQLIEYQLNEVRSFKEFLISELTKDPNDIRDLSEMRKMVQELPLQLVELNKKIDELFAM
jgi:hypothetical protein